MDNQQPQPPAVSPPQTPQPTPTPAPAPQPTKPPDSVQLPQESVLGDETPSGNQTLDEIEKSKRRIRHVESGFDALSIIRDVRFEKIMFVVGIGLIVGLTIVGYIFYSTIEIREQNLSLASQVEADFYARLLKDKDYLFNYELDQGVLEYDPLLNLSKPVSSARGLGDVDSQTRGGYTIKNGTNAQIIDSDGLVALELGDPSIHIDDLLLAPDGYSIVFDVLPADKQAEAKFGLRLGAYEIKLGDEEFETLVSDASTGIEAEDYASHFIQILSFSPNGRYLAYTNQNKLGLYDRLSGATIEIAELDSATQEPRTAWNERPGVEIETETLPNESDEDLETPS